jgi:hypothetical protein
MRPILYQRTAAFTINVSSGGMCLLMDWAPEWQEVLRVQVPMRIAVAKTPTPAEVRGGRALCPRVRTVSGSSA